MRAAALAFVLAGLLSFVTSAAARALEIGVSAGDYDVEKHLGDGPVEVDLVFRLTGTEIWRWEKHRIAVVPAFGGMATEDETVVDIPGSEIQVAGLPVAPDGMMISSVEVIVRLRRADGEETVTKVAGGRRA